MKLLAATRRGCELSPQCEVNMENVDVFNQIFFYGVAGVAGLIITIAVVVYTILGVRNAVAKGRRLHGAAYWAVSSVRRVVTPVLAETIGSSSLERTGGAKGSMTARRGEKAHAGRR